MDYNFNWNTVSSGAPYVTVSEQGLSFNQTSISMLSNPESVVVGFDENYLTIGVKDAKYIPGAKSYLFYDRMKSGWIRIGCKDFIKYLSEISGISFSPAKKYIAKYDKDERLLYFTIKDEDLK